MMILAVSTCLWSCQDDDPKPTVVEEPDWKLELVENDPEPEWEMPESGIYQFSMTGIMKLSDFLEGYADETDEVSAFIGNECRGVVKAQEYNGEKLFFLYIRGNSADTKSDSQILQCQEQKIICLQRAVRLRTKRHIWQDFRPGHSSIRRIRKVPGSDECHCGFSRVTAFRTTRQRYSGSLRRRRMPGCRDVDRNRWAQSVPV